MYFLYSLVIYFLSHSTHVPLCKLYCAFKSLPLLSLSYTQHTDSHLLATVIPKSSRHIPARKRVSPGSRAERLPYECYRLVCERLYGLVNCAAQYHYKLTKSEIKAADLYNTYVYQVSVNLIHVLLITVIYHPVKFAAIMLQTAVLK